MIVDGIEYWTRKDYLQHLGIARNRKSVQIAARPDAYTSGQGPGGNWQRSSGGIALYFRFRKDIIAELQSIADIADEVKRVEEAADRAFESRHISRKQKVRSLSNARNHYCGIGTRRTKLGLNKLAKTSIYAGALRLALEIEDKDLTAKKYHGGDVGGYSYSQIAYLDKHDGILKLIEVCKSEGWTFGVQKSEVFGASHVIYFDIPGVEQISWHFTPPSKHDLPAYSGVWDRKENSTLLKLEAAIMPLVNPGAAIAQAA
jgi:hypothetical protein